MKIPQEIGSSWTGKKYVHGPREIDPKECSEIRLGKVRKDGTRVVLCKLKKTGKWVKQSTLTPKGGHHGKIVR